MMENASAGITITVEYFALFRALTRKNEESLLVESASVSNVYRQLCERYGFSLEESSVHVAVNDEYATWDSQLRSGDKVVFIPPVSGG